MGAGMNGLAPRLLVASMALSGTGLVGIALYEGYTERAVIPVPGDVPTKGFGTTRNPDGSPVRLGDATTPPRALVDLLREAHAEAAALKRCLPGVALHQHEFDAYASLAYNVGAGAVCRSSIPVKLAAGDYAAACRTVLDFNGQCVVRDRAGKCLKKRVLPGLVKRRQAEYRQCMGGE